MEAVLSPDFVDGRFFRVTLLTDPRFGAVAQLIGGLSREELDANRQALALLPDGAELLDAPVVHEPVRLRMLAKASTFGILALEATIALFMLAPAARTSVRWRHAALCCFAASRTHSLRSRIRMASARYGPCDRSGSDARASPRLWS
jgi:hypothetical protein